MPGQPAGYSTKGCAALQFNHTVPAGTDHVHLRFNATREVSCLEGSGSATQCPRFVQQLILRSPGSASLAYDIFNLTAPSVPITRIDPSPAFRPSGATTLEASWFFQEVPSTLDPDFAQLRPSGAAYATDISDPILEFSGTPGFTAQADYYFNAGSTNDYALVQSGMARADRLALVARGK